MAHPEIELAAHERRQERRFEAIREGRLEREIKTKPQNGMAMDAELVYVEGLLAGYVYPREAFPRKGDWIARDVGDRAWQRKDREAAIKQLEMVAVASYREEVMP